MILISNETTQTQVASTKFEKRGIVFAYSDLGIAIINPTTWVTEKCISR